MYSLQTGRASTYVVPDGLRVSLHALGCFAHLLVEDSAMLRVDDVFEYHEAISVKGDDGCSDVLFGHRPRDTFLIRYTDSDWVLELQRRWTYGSHDDICRG